eukprot:TRINITY_DN23378_c0_g1_i1.p1 TRINITY_DN23378_c0_g1~~TRINITY_DN23378_c0_g1_i1.p1  ORF type:complete len:425 (+),score=154.55 TRINITY_DN23378_c0_g1_i1:22-1275(+)
MFVACSNPTEQCAQSLRTPCCSQQEASLAALLQQLDECTLLKRWEKTGHDGFVQLSEGSCLQVSACSRDEVLRWQEHQRKVGAHEQGWQEADESWSSAPLTTADDDVSLSRDLMLPAEVAPAAREEERLRQQLREQEEQLRLLREQELQKHQEEQLRLREQEEQLRLRAQELQAQAQQEEQHRIREQQLREHQEQLRLEAAAAREQSLTELLKRERKAQREVELAAERLVLQEQQLRREREAHLAGQEELQAALEREQQAHQKAECTAEQLLELRRSHESQLARQEELEQALKRAMQEPKDAEAAKRREVVASFLHRHQFAGNVHEAREAEEHVKLMCGLPFMTRKFYPLHVAAELGDAMMVELLLADCSEGFKVRVPRCSPAAAGGQEDISSGSWSYGWGLIMGQLLREVMRTAVF